MNIIFDLHRTLFDPDTKDLVPGARGVLEHFSGMGFMLHLVSKREGGRDELIDDFDIRRFFTTVSFVEDKTHPIEQICAGSAGEVYVVGDYLKSEIAAGNKAGATTIWLRRGKFADLTPEAVHEVPTFVITELEELKTLIQ